MYRVTKLLVVLAISLVVPTNQSLAQGENPLDEFGGIRMVIIEQDIVKEFDLDFLLRTIPLSWRAESESEADYELRITHNQEMAGACQYQRIGNIGVVRVDLDVELIELSTSNVLAKASVFPETIECPDTVGVTGETHPEVLFSQSRPIDLVQWLMQSAPRENLPEVTLTYSLVPPFSADDPIQIFGISDVGNINNERVHIRVSDDTLLSSNFTLSDRDGNTFLIDTSQLVSGLVIDLFTRSGSDNPTDLFWGLDAPIWSNGDVITIEDENGNLVVRSIVRRDSFREGEAEFVVEEAATPTKDGDANPAVSDPVESVGITSSIQVEVDNSGLVIESVQYVGDASREVLRITNTGNVISLTNWTLDDENGNRFVFPEFRLFSNGSVEIFTRSGTSTPVFLFWGSDTAIWNISEIITIRDNGGKIIESAIIVQQ